MEKHEKVMLVLKMLEVLQEGMACIDIQRVCWSLGCYSEDKGRKEGRKGRGVVH